MNNSGRITGGKFITFLVAEDDLQVVEDDLQVVEDNKQEVEGRR